MFLISSALALVAPDFCGAIQVTETLPDAANQDVPPDIRPAVVWGAGCLAVSYTATIQDGAGNQLLEEELTAASGIWWASTVLDLPPETELVLALTPVDDTGTLVSVPFATRSEPMVGLSGTPELEMEKLHSPKDSVTGNFTVTPVADPDQLSLVQVFPSDTPDFPLYTGMVDDQGTATTVTFDFAPQDNQNLCLTVMQWDAHGETVGEQEVCEKVGCSSVSAPMSLAWVAVLGLWGRRNLQRRVSC